MSTDTDERSKVIDAGDLHRYRTEIPNLLDDMDLSPYAYRLYGHYKRVAGDSGKCWQSRDTIAKACKMSAGMVTKAREELVAAKLIKTTPTDNPNGGNDYITVTIRDIWFENFKKYRPRSPGDGDDCEARSSCDGVIETESKDLDEARSPGDGKNKTLNGKEHQEKKNPDQAATAAPPPPPETPPEKSHPLTEGQRYFLDTWHAKRFKNTVQRDAILELERKYGTARLREVIEWAAIMGMDMGRAIRSMQTAIVNWGNGKPNGAAHKPPAAPRPPEPPVTYYHPPEDDAAEQLFGAKVAEPEAPPEPPTPEERRWEALRTLMREQLACEGYKASWDSHFEELELIAWGDGVLTLAAETELNRAWLASRMVGWMQKMAAGVAPDEATRIAIVVRAEVTA